MTASANHGMTPVLRNAISLFGLMVCLLDVQIQGAETNIFAGNFMPDQAIWLQMVRYGLCGGALVLSAMLVTAAPQKNLGFKRHGFLFLFLIAFCIATGIRSAMDMRNGLYLLATGSRHFLVFTLIAMAASLPAGFNIVRPLLAGAVPAFLMRFCYSLYRFAQGDGVEIIGGVRGVALDTGVMLFAVFFLFITVSKMYEHLERKNATKAFFWFVMSVPLVFFPISSFRRGIIVLTMGSLLIGVLLHAFANRVLLRRLLPITAVSVVTAAIGAATFAGLFGADVAMERLRSFALHDEGGLSASNEWYEQDSDYAFDLIKRNPVAGIGFSNPYGISGRDDDSISNFDTGGASEIILHVGMEELVVRQGIFGAAVWLLVFIAAPIRRVFELRSLRKPVSLVGCLSIGFLLIAANLPTAPPFYNEIRTAVFLGLGFGLGFTDDPAAVFGGLKPVTAAIRRLWTRTTIEPVAA